MCQRHQMYLTIMLAIRGPVVWSWRPNQLALQLPIAVAQLVGIVGCFLGEEVIPMVQEVPPKKRCLHIGQEKMLYQASFCIDDLRIANLKQEWPVAESCKQPDEAEQNMTDGHG